MASNVAQGSTRLILIGAAVLLSIGMGLRQSIGLFLTPVTRDLALTAADFTLTIAIQNIVWGLAQAPAGAIADRFGLRVTLVAGTVIYIAGLTAMAAAGGEMALIVSSVLIGIALACTASSLALAACARAVPERSRSKMLGVVAAIGSLGRVRRRDFFARGTDCSNLSSSSAESAANSIQASVAQQRGAGRESAAGCNYVHRHRGL